MVRDSRRSLSPLIHWRGTERYEIVRSLGRGGMGAVYEARDRESGQTLALKTLLHATPEGLYLFKREFRALADVDHPNLVRLYEFVMSDAEGVFFTMELVRGTDFVSFVRTSCAQSESAQRDLPTTRCASSGSVHRDTHGEVPIPRAPAGLDEKREPMADFDRLRPAVRQLVDGVMALHAARRLHRDIKPSNVLVTAEGRVVLLDFGVAAELSRASEEEMRERDRLVGTAVYMAPEQAFEEPGPPCDWYSVGVMLYEAIVGRPPFTGSVRDVLAMKGVIEPPPPSEHVRGVPADLDGLCHGLLRRQPAMRPSGQDILAQLGAPQRRRRAKAQSSAAERVAGTAASASLVGREALLEALNDAFAIATTRSMVTVCVSGRAGMGKSALVRRFLDDRAEEDHALTLRGRVHEREAVPYRAIDGIVDALSRYLICLDDTELAAMLPEDAWTLARLFPVLRRVPAIEALVPEPIADPLRARRRAFRALRELLSAVSRQRPLVLFTDDVQWGDTDSAALLLEIARTPDAPQLLLVLAYREDQELASRFLGELRAGWPRHAEFRVLKVGPLETEDATLLARELVGGDGTTAEAIVSAIARESGGSPLLIEELARHFASQASRSARASIRLDRVTLEQMVAQRLAQLPSEARRCLELIAVGGRPVPISIASEASGLNEASGEAFALLRVGRFVRSGMRGGREVLEIPHELIRETVLAQLSREAMREYHARLARALEAAGDADAEALATHLFGEGHFDRAIHFAEQAAEQAADKLAFDQAAHLLRLAIATLPASLAEGARLRKRLAEVLEWAGRGAEAGRVYLESAEGAAGFDRIDLERTAAEQFHASGFMEEGSQVLRRVLAALRVWAPRSPLSSFLWFLWQLVWLRVVGMRFRERDVSPEERRRIDTLNAVALGFALIDHILGVAMKARLLVVAMRAGDRVNTVRAAGLVALDLCCYTSFETATERELRKLANGLARGPLLEFSLGVTTALTAHHRGQFRESKEALDRMQAVVTNRRVGLQTASLYAMHSIQFLGDMTELTARYTRAVAEAEERGNLFMSVSVRTSHAASVWLAADNPERARRELREAQGQWQERAIAGPSWRAIAGEAEIDLYVGDGQSAYERVKSLSRALWRNYFFMYQSRVLVDFAQGRAAVASLCQLRGRERSTRLREARRWARTLRKKRAPWVAPLALILEGSAAAATGHRRDAEEWLRAAATAADTVGMALHAAAARHELGMLVGGGEGAELVRQADEDMGSLGVRSSDRFALMLVPGRR